MYENQTYRPRFSMRKMATLLGISEEEFAQLSHTGVRDLKDSYGVVYKHYIQFSPNNDLALLEKMNLNRSNTVYFTPDQVKRI